ERRSGLAKPKARVGDRDLGPDLFFSGTRFAADRQRLLEVSERTLVVTHPVIGGAQVVQERGFPQPVAELALQRERRLIGFEGRSEIAEVVFEDAEVVEGPRLPPPVAERALQSEDLPRALERRLGLAQTAVDRRQVEQHVRFPESLLASLREEVERLLIAAQGLAQVSLGMEGQTQIVLRLAFLIRTAETALERHGLSLRRGSTGRIAQRRAREAEAAPCRRLPRLLRELGEPIERLLVKLPRRLRLAEGKVERAQRELTSSLLQPAPERVPMAPGLFIPRGGEPLVLRAALAVGGGRLGHQPLGFHALAAGGRLLRQLLQKDGVLPRRHSRARRQHPDLQRTRHLRRKQDGFRTLAVVGAVDREQELAVRLPHL